MPVQFRWIPSLKLLPKSLKLKSRLGERASVMAQKPKLAAAMPLGRLWARMLRMLSAGAQFPLILWLRAPDKPHERLAESMQTGFHWQTRMPVAPGRRTRPGGRLLAVLSKCGGPLKWDRLTYSEWQLELEAAASACRGWFAVGTRIEDINVTMRRRQQPPGQLLISSSLRRRQQPEP